MPCGPCAPSAPGAPAGPSGPCGPTGPCAPSAPAGPGGPSGPCGPCGPGPPEPGGPCVPAATMRVTIGSVMVRTTRRVWRPVARLELRACAPRPHPPHPRACAGHSTGLAAPAEPTNQARSHRPRFQRPWRQFQIQESTAADMRIPRLHPRPVPRRRRSFSSPRPDQRTPCEAGSGSSCRPSR